MTRTLEKILHAEAASLGMTVEMIRQHRSLIYAVSTASGSTFRVSLPARPSAGRGASAIRQNLISTLRRQSQLAETSTKKTAAG